MDMHHNVILSLVTLFLLHRILVKIRICKTLIEKESLPQ